MAQTQSCTKGLILPGTQGAVVLWGHFANVDPLVLGAQGTLQAPAEQGMGSVALLSSEVKDGGPDEQGHEGWYLLLATTCLQEAVSTYKDLLPQSPCVCPLLTHSGAPVNEPGQPAISWPPIPIPKTTAKTAELPFKDRRRVRLSPFQQV